MENRLFKASSQTHTNGAGQDHEQAQIKKAALSHLGHGVAPRYVVSQAKCVCYANV